MSVWEAPDVPRCGKKSLSYGRSQLFCSHSKCVPLEIQYMQHHVDDVSVNQSSSCHAPLAVEVIYSLMLCKFSVLFTIKSFFFFSLHPSCVDKDTGDERQADGLTLCWNSLFSIGLTCDSTVHCASLCILAFLILVARCKFAHLYIATTVVLKSIRGFVIHCSHFCTSDNSSLCVYRSITNPFLLHDVWVDRKGHPINWIGRHSSSKIANNNNKWAVERFMTRAFKRPTLVWLTWFDTWTDFIQFLN